MVLLLQQIMVMLQMLGQDKDFFKYALLLLGLVVVEILILDMVA